MDHTPGPWRVGDAGHTVFGPKTDNPSPKIIASNLSHADAKIMAAGPDMLEALRDLIQWADAVIGEPDKAMGEQTYGNKVIKAAVVTSKAAA